ncbi:MAG: ribokinase [Gleimia sp.]|jgi:ribokinase
MSRIVVVGSINLDLISHVERHPNPGETLAGSSVSEAPGGKGANQALAARLLGADVTMVGAVGDDSNADVALKLLDEASVDLSLVKVTSDSTTGLAVITVSDDGENTIVYIAGANSLVSPDDAKAAIASFREDDILLLQGELSRETTEAAARSAMDRGVRVVLNVAPWGELDRDVLLGADPLVLNEHELRLAARSLFGDDFSDLSEIDLARKLIDEGAKSLIVTLGSRGSFVITDKGYTEVAAEKVQAVDTTGAGDAFVGAVAARLATGDSLEDATRIGNQVGAWVVRHHGAQPSYPSAEDLSK